MTKKSDPKDRAYRCPICIAKRGGLSGAYTETGLYAHASLRHGVLKVEFLRRYVVSPRPGFDAPTLTSP